MHTHKHQNKYACIHTHTHTIQNTVVGQNKEKMYEYESAARLCARIVWLPAVQVIKINCCISDANN